MTTNVLIAAGGTGGHIFPGIAVAREFLRREPDARITFAGTARGMETRVVPDAGFGLELIDVAGLNRVGLAQVARTMMKLPGSFMQAAGILRRLRPDVVIGIGGYASGPVLLAASLKRRPTLVIEPNALPGLTNRLLAPWVRAAALSFAETERFFQGKAVLTGNPVRPEFFSIAPRPEIANLHVLAVGGSQGSHAINLAMISAVPSLLRRHARLTVTLQTGERDFETVRSAAARSGLEPRWEVRRFVGAMAEEFERADLVISRAGATTIAEITAAGRPSVLIPLPTAADDHQRRNAEALAGAGAAVCLPQSEMTAERLTDEIEALLLNPGRRREMAKASRGLAHRDAAREIVDLAYRLIKGEPVLAGPPDSSGLGAAERHKNEFHISEGAQA
ncbi:MAG: undecaprenyldiphospho-muramoylpentapeptide beta-N-acetylglucosaminyltransferase [Acidobacteria bacterium]|nr:undecaprenyldiphospho-muramoylpentapeptide beta-N-acetylglucosaminyltransferase [Acidobacteriota bacterium]